ncbi:Neurobeachin-like protein 1 [Chytridiales sp. JEL 0842]|nr:Neurobeachin-like protein 1 [Chytridiales sp. JEL 0842]
MSLATVVQTSTVATNPAGSINTVEIAQDIHDSLVFDFRLWASAEHELQLEHISFISHFVGHNREENSRYNVTYFMDILETYYWLLPPGGLPLELLSRLSRLRQTDIGAVLAMRAAILRILKTLLEKPRAEDIARINASLWASASDETHTSDIIELITDMVCENERFHDIFVANASIVDCLFWVATKSQHEKCRVSALYAIFKLSQVTKAPEKVLRKLRVEDLPGTLAPLGASLSGAVIANSFEPPTWSSSVYFALLQILLRRKITPPTDITEDWNQCLMSVESPSVDSTGPLSALLHALSSLQTDDIRMRKKILGNISALIREGGSETIRKIPAWPSMMLRLLKKAPSNAIVINQIAVFADKQSNGDDLIVEMFAEIILDSLNSERSAWKIMEEITVYAWHLDESLYAGSAIEVIRSLFTRTLSILRASVKVDDMKAFSRSKMENIWHILLLCEEVMFNHLDLQAAYVAEKQSKITEDGSMFTDLNAMLRSTSFASDEMSVHISLPFDECAPLVLECLEFISSHIRNGGLMRFASRLLFSALATPRNESWDTVLGHMTALFDKFADSSTTSQQLKGRVFHTMAHVHDALKGVLSSSSGVDHNGLLSFYMFLMSRWQDIFEKLTDMQGRVLVSEEELSDAMRSPEAFLQFISSEQWNLIYDILLYPAFKAIEQDELLFAPLIVKRYAKAVRFHLLRQQKEAAAVVKASTACNNYLKAQAHRRSTEEIARFSEKTSSQENERKALIKSWISMYQSMASGRGLWSSGLTESWWKLDKVENNMRMRRRMKPNNEYDDHKDAAARRDKTHAYSSDSLQSSPQFERARVSESLPATLALTAMNRRISQLQRRQSYMESGTPVAFEMGSSETIENESLIEDVEWHQVNEEEADLRSTISTDAEDNVVCSVECEMILLMMTVKGRLEVTSSYCAFIADLKASAASLNEADRKTLILLIESESLQQEKRWPLSNLIIYPRRYMLRNSALEFFFSDKTIFMFNFQNVKDKMRVLSKIIQVKPPNLVNADPRNPIDILRKSGVTEKWQRREISNFEYLMHLNTISERYEFFEDPTVKKFMYGSHYSSSASVLFYLLRLEPFTSLHIGLQGKFDHPDRQFHSIETCWNSVLTGNSDVKELIPEFFYMPEFLVNENRFDLGTKQKGEKVDDVILPPWAKTPEDFVRIQREALEGEYVSAHLHEWIDLIWGYKQRGAEAIKAHNVFYYLTYEGSIDINSIKDPTERKSIEDQINNFGQTPSQLFFKPHPKRNPKSPKSIEPLFKNPALHNSYMIQMKPEGHLQYLAVLGREDSTDTVISTSSSATGTMGGALPALLGASEREWAITIDSNLVVGVHRWISDAGDQMFQIEPDTRMPSKRILPVQLASNIKSSSNLFACSKDGRFLFTAGYWDSSFRILSVDPSHQQPPQPVDIVYGHHDVVTCLFLAEDNKTLVTGSKDTSVFAWDVYMKGGDLAVRQDTRRAYYGHDEETAMTFSSIHVYSINGKHLAKRQFSHNLSAFTSSKDGEFLVTVDERGSVILMKVHSLEVTYKYDVGDPLLSVSIPDSQQFILIGKKDGELLIIAPDSKSLKTKRSGSSLLLL